MDEPDDVVDLLDLPLDVRRVDALVPELLRGKDRLGRRVGPERLDRTVDAAPHEVERPAIREMHPPVPEEHMRRARDDGLALGQSRRDFSGQLSVDDVRRHERLDVDPLGVLARGDLVRGDLVRDHVVRTYEQPLGVLDRVAAVVEELQEVRIDLEPPLHVGRRGTVL